MKLITSVHINTSENLGDTPVYERLELFDFESIELTSSIQDVRDIGSVFTDFSQQFTIPASQVNNKLLNHFYNQSVANGYDARVKRKGYISLSGIGFRNGYIRLSEAILKNGKPFSYSITFFGQMVSLKDILGDDELKELNTLAVYNHDYNLENVYNGFTEGLGLNSSGEMTSYDVDAIDRDVIYPSISVENKWYYNSSGDSPLGIEGAEVEFNQGLSKNLYVTSVNDLIGIDYTELKPAIKVKRVIEAIEERYSSIIFSDDFFSGTNFNNLYLLLHNKKGSLANSDTGLSDEMTFWLGTGAQGDFNVTPTNSDLLPITTKQTPTAGFSNLVRQADVFVDITAVAVNGSGNYTIDILDGDDNVLSSGSYSDTSLHTLYFNLSSVNEKRWSLRARIKSKDKELETFSLQVRLNISEERVDIDDFGQPEIVTDVFGATYTSKESTMVDTVVIYGQIPKMTIISFLKGLFKMFNLTAYVDDGIIIVKTLSQYYADGNDIDLSSELDLSEVSVKRAKLFSNINLKFSDPKTFGVIKQNEITQDNFGNLEFQTTDNGRNGSLVFDGGKYEVKLPFEKLFFERLSNEDDNEPTPFSHGWLVDKDQRPTATKPVLFYNIPTNINTTTHKLSFKQKAEYITKYNRPSNTTENESESLHFGEEMDEFTANPIKNSLFKLYYSDYINNLFEKTSRIVTYNTVLKLSTLLKYKLNDLVTINGKDYRINNIKTNLTNGKSEIELITNFDIVSPVLSSDVTPPTVPTNLTIVSSQSNSINISWTASTDNDAVEGYEVYVNGVLNFRGVTSTTYEVLGLVGSTTYNIQVLAYDSDDNKSNLSSTATGTTTSGGDTTPPNAVIDLASPPQGNTGGVLNLSWTKPFDNVGVVGYDIHLNQSNTPTVSVGDVVTHSFTGLSLGDHRAVIYAKDAIGNISAVSNIINTTIYQ